MVAKSHRRCGHCNGVVPIADRQCPYCSASLENYGLFGRVLDGILPEEAGATKVIFGLTVLIQLAVGLAAGGTSILAPSSYTLLHFGSGFVPWVLDGEWWRLVTPVFLHGGIIHIGFNLYALWLLGPLFERSFGRSRYVIIFVLSGVLSTMIALMWKVVAPDVLGAVYSLIPFVGAPSSSSITTSMVGMSGALCGLLGVGVATGHRVQNVAGTAVRNQCLRWAGFLVLFGLVVPGVDNAAHFSGFAIGAVLGWFLPLKDRASYVTGWFWGAVSALCVALVAGSLAAQALLMPWNLPADLDLYPTGLFGVTLREGNLEDDVVKDAELACRRDLGAVEQGDQSPEMRDRAVLNCDEILRYAPRVAKLWVISAQAHLFHGDRAVGCRRLYIASTIIRYDPGNRDPKFLAALEALRGEACR